MWKTKIELAKEEYDFYLQETSIIRKFFSEKYLTQYSPDGVLSPEKMFLKVGGQHVVLLMKENRNYDYQLKKVTWSICDKPENTYDVHKSLQNSSNTWAEIICGTVNSVQTRQWDESSASGFAYINVKKRDEGKSLSKDKDLNAYAIEDSEYLRRQILSCRPDIIFCCGHRQINKLWKVFFPNKRFRRKEWQIPSCQFAYKIQYTYPLDDSERFAIAIDWKHPSLNRLDAKDPKRVNDIKEELKNRIKQLQSYNILK